MLTVFSKEDPEGQRRVTALQQRLQELGWVDGRNVRIELRWAGGDPDRARFYAGELVGMKPDVIFINHALVLPLLRQETHAIPIVFVQIADPVADGLVASLSQPGGNMTGFTTGEYAMIFKIIAFVTAAVPIFLFVRSMFFRRPARTNEGFKEFKKQSDLAVSIFLLLIGCVVLFTAGKLVWAWL
ncbi:MAG TPA: ABC transporter substrate binding protein [Xanthobacteraceae bacterium]|nr:ABC transporter substrate binding protein [Xanthobacteraceae bacterium]